MYFGAKFELALKNSNFAFGQLRTKSRKSFRNRLDQFKLLIPPHEKAPVLPHQHKITPEPPVALSSPKGGSRTRSRSPRK